MQYRNKWLSTDRRTTQQIITVSEITQLLYLFKAIAAFNKHCWCQGKAGKGKVNLSVKTTLSHLFKHNKDAILKSFPSPLHQGRWTASKKKRKWVLLSSWRFLSYNSLYSFFLIDLKQNGLPASVLLTIVFNSFVCLNLFCCCCFCQGLWGCGGGW